MREREQILPMARGDSATFVIPVVAADGVTPVPLTGSTIWFTAKYRLTDEDIAAPIRKSTATTGVTITNGPGGVAQVDLLSSDTSALTQPTTLYWDVQARDGASAIRTLAHGRLVIRLDVTKAIV